MFTQSLASAAAQAAWVAAAVAETLTVAAGTADAPAAPADPPELAEPEQAVSRTAEGAGAGGPSTAALPAGAADLHRCLPIGSRPDRSG
ncbi:hypothetical protein [Candidatus Frankia alpina]|uniref:hypothetical protein n=1 Tax=Candidatus Frankia alpina TaxID=2699483 RepID=UPI001F229ABC|nr:hypothetical protein [Candidatus Frankia alpina]